jgi:hypothetical protein
MSLMERLRGEYMPKYMTYDVVIYYRCKNCGETILIGKRSITIELLKDWDEESLLMRAIIHDVAPGFYVLYGGNGDSTYYPFKPHHCKDGGIGVSEFSSFKIINKQPYKKS